MPTRRPASTERIARRQSTLAISQPHEVNIDGTLPLPRHVLTIECLATQLTSRWQQHGWGNIMLRLVIGAALALAALTWSNAQCMQMPTGFSLPSSSVFAAD